MANMTYPGVYIQEVSGGPRAIAGASTSVAAFIGWFPAGPVDEPVAVTSWGEAQRRFGGLHDDSEASYALWMFFRNGGSTAWVVRLMKANGQPAEVGDPATLEFGKATLKAGSADAIVVTARDPGAAGNAISVTVSYPEVGEAGTFDLTIARGQADGIPDLPPLTETFQGLDLTGAKGTRPDDIDSALVVFETTGTTRPDEGETSLVGGGTLSQQIVTTALADYDAYKGNQDLGTGLHAFDKTPFNLLCLPGVTYKAALEDAVSLCERRLALLVVDAPVDGSQADPVAEMRLAMIGDTNNPPVLPRSNFAAVYFPWVDVQDPLRNGAPRAVGPSGIIAGLAARTDNQVGVWKAPAGTDTPLVGVWRLRAELTDRQNGLLNPIGVNCLRRFDSAGMVSWGARTLRGADSLSDRYKYVPVRRLALFIEQSLHAGTQWVVFQPNNELLWRDVRISVSAFMSRLYDQGAFTGATPEEAWFVRCDRETTTPYDQDNGILNVVVGFAPARPAEFVVIRIQQIQQLATA